MARAGFEELFRGFYGALESVPVAYFAYGGVAVGVWGDPRETQDVDAVVVIGEQETSAVLDVLTRDGFECSADHRRLFPIDGWARLEFQGRYGDLALGRTAFDESAFGRRRRMTIYGLPIWVACAEDLVLYKLVAYRYKDLADAEAVLTRHARKRVGVVRGLERRVSFRSGNGSYRTRAGKIPLRSGRGLEL